MTDAITAPQSAPKLVGLPNVILEAPAVVEHRSGAGRARLSLMSSMFVERGTIEDWHRLEALHYKSSELGYGSTFMRLVLQDEEGKDETIGVMTFAYPKILDAGRNEVFPHLKANQGGIDTRLVNSMRTKWLNDNITLSARTVLDTMYRGVGVAYRFKNLGYRMTGYRFVESRSSMSRYNPFSAKAGMRFVKPRDASGMEKGLLFLSRNFKSPAYDFTAIMQELKAMPEHVFDRTLEDMRQFYYDASALEKSGDKRDLGRSRVDALPLDKLLRGVMQLTFGATVYAIFQNPDYGRTLPERIPLSAFENQGLHEPLNLEAL